MLLLFWNGAGQAAAPVEAPPGDTLVVATKEAPPFALRQPDGTWRGVSIELWQEVAERLERPFVLRETTLPLMLQGVEDGTYDAAVAALTITAEREATVDFTHPFYVSGLGIAVRVKEGGWMSVTRRFLSVDFLKVIGALTVVLLVVGVLVWLFERRRNPEHFGGTPAQGIGAGFWWSAVTMTTVGYGDKAPASLGGRLVALVWMFAALIIISSFTAAITSALTVSRLETSIEGLADLPKVQAGTVEGSTSALYLQEQRLGFATFPDAKAALRALRDGSVEAVVYDAPILRYLLRDESAHSLRVLPQTFDRQYYGIALPEESTLRNPVNRVLLEIIEQPAWQDVLYRYLGEDVAP